MLKQPDPQDLECVARHALRLVADGMVLGLGTGRAAEAFIHALGTRARAGMRVQVVVTSSRSDELARRLNLDVVALADVDRLDLAFDGADEVTPALALTKGLGGALLRERVVAFEAARFVVLVTAEKLVAQLGTRSPIPVEIVPFASRLALRELAALGAGATLRRKPGGAPFVTDNQHWIIDAAFAPIADPAAVDAQIRRIPGVVDTGIFLDLASLVLVGDAGAVRELKPPPR